MRAPRNDSPSARMAAIRRFARTVAAERGESVTLGPVIGSVCFLDHRDAPDTIARAHVRLLRAMLADTRGCGFPDAPPARLLLLVHNYLDAIGWSWDGKQWQDRHPERTAQRAADARPRTRIDTAGPVTQEGAQ